MYAENPPARRCPGEASAHPRATAPVDALPLAQERFSRSSRHFLFRIAAIFRVDACLAARIPTLLQETKAGFPAAPSRCAVRASVAPLSAFPIHSAGFFRTAAAERRRLISIPLIFRSRSVPVSLRFRL